MVITQNITLHKSLGVRKTHYLIEGKKLDEEQRPVADVETEALMLTVSVRNARNVVPRSNAI